MSSNKFSSSFNSVKYNKTDPNLSKSLLSKNSHILSKTLNKQNLNSTSVKSRSKSRSKSKPKVNIDPQKIVEKKDVEVKNYNVSSNMYNNLKEQYDSLNNTVTAIKKENLIYKRNLKEGIENLKKENENLKMTQDFEIEETNKNIAEYINLNDHLRLDIENTKKLIEDKKKEIEGLKMNFQQLKTLKKENFERLLELGKNYEENNVETNCIIQEYKPKKYVDLFYAYKKIKEQVNNDDLESFFSPLDEKAVIINEMKYYNIDKLNSFLEENKIFKEREVIKMNNFSDIINVEFFINAIKMINIE